MSLRLNLSALIAALLLPSLTGTGTAQQTTAPLKPNLPSKKLIEFGWDQVFAANPEFIRDNIREMEKRPFDGIAFALPDPVTGYDTGGRVFQIEGWNEEKLRPQLKTLSEIKWNKFTDNFITIFSASTMDWFSDSDWETVTAHTKFMASAAKVAHCKGILLDAEPYGKSPWIYEQQKHAKTKSFEEYLAKVRQRGKQFMDAMQGEMPSIKILTLFQYSLFAAYPEYPGHEPSSDPQKRLEGQIANPYALMAAFFDGMLEAAGPEVQFIDGNEFAYFYKNPLEFYRSYHTIGQTAKLYVAPELRDKYSHQVQAGQSMYLDYLYNLRPDYQITSPTVGMTPQQRSRWVEHNAYYALQTSDEYVWLWSENWNWWNNKAKNAVQQPESATDDVSKALISAKGKIDRAEALGFDIADDIKAGEANRTAKQTANLLRREAKVAQFTTKQSPVIDGKLDEAIYGTNASLDTFVAFYKPDELRPVKAATRSWVYSDDKNLYIAFRCYEPQMKTLKSIGIKRDGEVWKGDSIEISIRTNPADTVVHHFILNPDNIQWDSRDQNGKSDLSYNPHWKSAVQRGINNWTVEAAIPWSELKIPAPAKGTSLQANLARQRTGEQELTSWSQFVSGFQEIENFGTWKF